MKVNRNRLEWYLKNIRTHYTDLTDIKKFMTPKEKAQQLVERYNELGKDFTRGISMKEFSKQQALTAIDWVIENTSWGSDIDDEIEDGSKEYYIKVKQEIEKL